MLTESPIKKNTLPLPPAPGPEAGRRALRALIKGRNILTALEAIHQEMGDVFRMPLPGFNPIFLVGPEANRFVTVTGREDLRWRSEGDPVTDLLREGVLVTDGELHDHLRRAMLPSLHRSVLAGYADAMLFYTDQVLERWGDDARVDMLVEMRRIAILILVGVLFQEDMNADIDRLWPAILRTLAYISPGAWLVVPGLPRPGYGGALRQMDRFLYQLIAARRAALAARPPKNSPTDLLGLLITSGMQEGRIRDQLLTMLIAGHDTSTALLAWTLYLLGQHPEVKRRVHAEVQRVLKGAPPTFESVQALTEMEKVVQETLRLYPPIHIGNRRAAQDLEFNGYRIPAGTRVVYSIYLTHRQERYWPDPHRFDPERFTPEEVRQRPHYIFVPFGGGPRNCIGLAFAQVEVKIVLARLLQRFDLEPDGPKVHAHMGATLEPRPGVWMRLRQL